MPPELDFAANLDRSRIPAGADASLKLHLTVRAPADLVAAADTPLTSSICLVFDCSTSMQGPKLEAAVTAAKMIVATAGERHRISLIGFQSKSHLLIDNAAAADADIDAKIGQLRLLCGGSTNLAAGIEMGMQTMLRSPADACVMVILSDGQANDAAKAERAAITTTAAGIQIFAVGIGADYEADHLLKLVNPSNGALFGEADLDKIEGTFAGLMGRIERFVATDAQVTIALRPGTSSGAAYKTSPEQAFLGTPAPDASRRIVLNVGNVEQGETYGFLLDLGVPAGNGALDVAAVSLRYDLPALNLRDQMQEIAISVTRDADAVVAENYEVVEALRGARVAQLGFELGEAVRKHDVRKINDCLDALAADPRLAARCDAARDELRDRGRIGKESLNALVVASTAKAAPDRTLISAQPDPTLITKPVVAPPPTEVVGADWSEITGVDAPATGLYDVVLIETGKALIQLVRELRDATGLPLRKVSDLVGSVPSAVAVGMQHADATLLEQRIQKVGGRVELRPHAAA